VWFDADPQVASIEIGNGVFGLAAGVSMEEDTVALIEELGDGPVIEEVITMVVPVIVENGSEDISDTTDASITEPEED
jgi:hypothetical protein